MPAFDAFVLFFDIRKGLTESNDSELNGKIKYKHELVLNFQNKQNIETKGDEILSFRLYFFCKLTQKLITSDIY